MISNGKPNFSLEKIYVLSIKAVILVIPFLSLYVAPSMIFPYITGKNFTFRLLVEAATVLWLGLMVLDKEYRLRNSAMLWLVLAFTFIVGLADLTGTNPYNSLWSTYERMDGYLNILHLCLYFMIIKSVFRAKKDWAIYLNIFVLVSFLMNIDTLFNILKHKVDFLNDIYILLQEVGYRGTGDSAFFRPLGRIGNAAFFASYLLLTMLISMILAINAKRLWLKAVYVAAIGLNLLLVYFTATRGAMLALVIGIILFSLFYVFGKAETGKDRLLRKISAAVLVGVALLSILFFVFRDSSLIKQNPTFSRISMISTSDTTTQLRLITWSMAWEGIKERPVLGWGQGNFPHIYTKYFDPRLYGLETWIDHAHNVVLDWLVNAGFIGLLFYLGIFGMVFYILWSAFTNKTISKTLAVTIISGLVVYLFQNLFVFDSINTNIIFFALLAYVDNLNDIKLASSHPHLAGKQGRPARTGGEAGQGSGAGRSLFTAAAVLIIFAFFAYFINYKPIKEAQLLTRLSVTPAYQAGMSDKYKSFFDVLEDFRQALAYETFGDKYVRMSMAGISENILKSGSISGPDALKFIEATAVELEKHAAADPNNLENLYPLVTLLNNMAEYDASFIKKAEVYIKECLRLSPKNQWVYFILADNYVLKKDYENAFISIKKAADLDPEKDESQFKLAMAAILASHPPAGRAGGSSTKYDIAEDALENVKKIRSGKDSDLPTGQAGADLERKSVFKITELYALAGVSMEVKNYHLALRFYKELIDVSPKDAKYHFEIANIYLVFGDKVNAIEEAMKAAEIDPANYAGTVKDFIRSIDNAQ